MGTTTIRHRMIFGVHPKMPLKGFPDGKKRLRMRGEQWAQVFVRPPEGGIRAFYIKEHDGHWIPAIESGSNSILK